MKEEQSCQLFSVLAGGQMRVSIRLNLFLKDKMQRRE